MLVIEFFRLLSIYYYFQAKKMSTAKTELSNKDADERLAEEPQLPNALNPEASVLLPPNGIRSAS